QPSQASKRSGYPTSGHMTGVSEDGGNCLRREGCSLRSCRTLGYSRVSGQRLARQGQIREVATEIDLQRRQQGFEHCLSITRCAQPEQGDRTTRWLGR